MSRVRAEDTKPEMAVRRTAHALGYRFRLHRKGLPGRPDLVFPARRAVVFVHGCFWHRHPNCPKSSMPKTRIEFWQAKFAANVHRDEVNVKALGADGWRVLVIWECETRGGDDLRARLKDFLG